jgi:hypothetical protein
MVAVMKNNQRENKMTTVETMQLIGMQGTIFVGGLNVDVTIKDIKQAYGKTRYQVEPVAGRGSVWVESISLDVLR